MQRLGRLGAILVVTLLAGLVPASPAAAGGPVDPSTLTPEPPPGATCYSVTSTSVLCNTFKDFSMTKQLVFDVSCGHLYETSVDHRDGIRWYVHGKAVRKQVHGTLKGTWSRSKSATGKVVKIVADWSEWTVWKTPGDDATAAATAYGLQFRATATGLGDAILWFARVDPDNSSHGLKIGFKTGAQTLAADFTINSDDLTSTPVAALSRVLC